MVRVVAENDLKKMNGSRVMSILHLNRIPLVMETHFQEGEDGNKQHMKGLQCVASHSFCQEYFQLMLPVWPLLMLLGQKALP